MKCIVTTSIYPPSKATLKYIEMKDWTFIIVGDLITPHEAYDDLMRQHSNVIYLRPSRQEDLYQELSDAIGWRKVMRRNIGFVHAYKLGAEIVATIDDDNIPYENWGQNILVGQDVKVNIFTNKSGVFDPLYETNYPYLWHRGFPIDFLNQRDEDKVWARKEIKVLFQADLWDGDPDIDAVCRKIYHPKNLTLKVKDYYIPYSSTDYSPFNSQNTFIAREALPYYMCLPFVGRMDDIWGGYIAQHLLNTRPVFMPPTVWQERNEQSLDKNFEDEVLGYTTTYKMLQDMENWEKYLPEKALHAFNAYRRQFDV